MSFFARKSDTDLKLPGESEPTPKPVAQQPTAPVNTAAAGSRAYGVADIILLMRNLPVDQNVDLVVKVVTKTLASLGIRVPDVIADAARRQHLIQERIGALKTQIAELDREVEVRRQEISRLEMDLRETNVVRERLSLAERPANGPAATATPAPTQAAAERPQGSGFTPAAQGSRGGRAIAVPDGVATVVRPDPSAAAGAAANGESEDKSDGPTITVEDTAARDPHA